MLKISTVFFVLLILAGQVTEQLFIFILIIYMCEFARYRSFSLSRNKKINWKPSSGRSQENEMLIKD